ncbi:isochorismate synthase [uncultured Flavobacterium sp.]|uniref:isochorismate synthase n=1 Tax=uncultured Flavobacterium sp. TaxID=165435 RepID=UPI0025CFC508|nr:isochorismate synthase [uncultured Flavobacterium sp.]
MIHILSKIASHLELQLPFAVFCKPGANEVTGLFQREQGVHYLEKYTDPGFVFAPFSGDRRVFIPLTDADVIIADYTGNIDVQPATQPEIDYDAKITFESLVAKSVAAIRSGTFEKLVCSRTERVKCNTDVTVIYERLLKTYPDAYRYCFYTPETGLWMGATPEQLLRLGNTSLHTVALAGTQKYAEGEIIWEDKEKQEQQFVTDYIINELSGVVAHIETKGPYTFRAGNLVHIKTDITAGTGGMADLKQIIDALHPTPAVCGLPKHNAMQFLLDNEGYDREHYSGFLGELNMVNAQGERHTDLFVNLRSMKINGNAAQLFIGCGITKDSDPEKEFIETVNKSMTMRRVL